MQNYNADRYQQLATQQIQCNGWIGKQLEVQATGLTGHLDEIWADVGPNSGWLGGDGENWERGPYYLDGLVPLAYLRSDGRLIAKASRWIEAILASQDESGFFGPKNNDDWWPRMVALKVLQEYYEATADGRVLRFMERYFAYQARHIEGQPLIMWAVARAGENVLTLLWLYERTQNDALLDLADTLLQKSLDWEQFFSDLPYKKPMQHYLDWNRMAEIRREYGPLEIADPQHLTKTEASELFEKYHLSHGVNIAMAMKYPALRYKLRGDSTHLAAIKRGLESLDSYHGQIHGLYSCDEHLNGKEPTTGVELCTVVESMFSLEKLIQTTGDPEFADLLERIAYNALPATIAPDYTSHQYDQQINQVLCSIDRRDWYNNTDTSNIFGLEPHFGCCLANMHQGWPKFARSLWFQGTTDDGELELLAMQYAPSAISATQEESTITIEERTDYPYGEQIELTIGVNKPIEFTLGLRVPGWASSYTLSVNGRQLGSEQDAIHRIRRVWTNGDTVTLSVPMEPVLHRDADSGHAYVTKGPILYSLPVSGEWKKVVDRGRFSDWEVHPREEWAYALVVGESREMSATRNGEWQGLFGPNDPPDWINVVAKPVTNWRMYHNSAGPIPDTPDCASELRTVRLIPYAASDLRLSLFPTC